MNDEPKYSRFIQEFFDENSKNRVVLMTTKASKVYTKFKFRRNDILLFGRESAGAPDFVHSSVDERLTIPMVKGPRSINLSSSVAIVAGEMLRQLT
jgi:tRNA (cytidine/uridine-2'-O-)-methyltransferase